MCVLYNLSVPKALSHKPPIKRGKSIQPEMKLIPNDQPANKVDEMILARIFRMLAEFWNEQS